MKEEIHKLRGEISKLKRTTGYGFTAGKSVTIIIRFDDIDVNKPNFNSSTFEDCLLRIFSVVSRVPVDKMIIICIKDNEGSTNVELEIQYHSKSDTKIQSYLSDFILTLNEGIIENLQEELGDYTIISFSVGAIESILCKISKIKNKFQRTEINFESSDSIILGDYRLKIKDSQLFVQRFDHYIGEYVGGTLVTD